MSRDQRSTGDRPRKKPAEKSATYGALTTVLLLAGVFGILLGLIHFLSLLAQGPSTIGLGDMVFNTAAGVLALICWRLLKAGNGLVIPLFFAGIVLSLAFSLVLGRGFNPLTAGFGAIILLQMVLLQRAGELD